MTNPDAAKRKHWLATRFQGKASALRDTRSYAANWLYDFRDSLAVLFGLNQMQTWGHLVYESGIYLMLEILDMMEKERLLPVIHKYAYDTAKSEWDRSDSQAVIRREMNFALNTKLRGVLEFFSTAIEGLPIAENDGARAHLHNELGKLFRMRRLSR